jgi:hypothetical protein
VNPDQKNIGLWDRVMSRFGKWMGPNKQAQTETLHQQLQDTHLLRQKWQQQHQQQGTHAHSAYHHQQPASDTTKDHPGRSLQQQGGTGGTSGNTDAVQTLTMATLLATLLGTQQGQGGAKTVSGG